MKNKQIVDAWNKIEPDKTAEDRMLGTILARKTAEQSEKGKVFNINKTLSWKRFAPVAACFVLVIALVAVVGNNTGWFGNNVLTANLGGGDTLSFHKSDLPGVDSFAYDFDVTSRDLTENEIQGLFGELPVTAYATFNTETKAFVHLEGKIGETKVIAAAPGMPVTDTPIEVNGTVSDVYGVPVTAGYFVTKANSQGIKNIIYFASFTLGNTTMYVERGGAESESEALRSEIGTVIEQLIQNGAPNLSLIAE